MTERFEIKAHEHGVVRLFAVDLPAAEVDGFATPGADGWPLRDALGADTLDPDEIEVFPVSDLTGLGLPGYMIEGLGIAEADVAEDRARLDALKGHVAVVRSRAFGGVAQEITPRAPLRWIGTYVEERAPVQFSPLPDEAARGAAPAPERRAPSQAAMSGRVAMLALLVIFALVAVMVWIA